MTRPLASAPVYDYSKIRRISVVPFDGPGGQSVTDEWVRELVGHGIEVTDAKHPGDAILRGAVTEYKSNYQMMVVLGDNNPIVSPNAQTTPDGIALIAHKPQVATLMAVVGVQARLIDASSQKIVWADSYIYEGLDLPSTLGIVVETLKKSLGRVLPRMSEKKP